MFEFFDRVRRTQANNSNKNELEYDPRCGVSKEVFEWQCHQQERVSYRMPEVMRKIRFLTQKMHSSFQDDPEGLKKWEAYEKNVLHAYECKLQISLSSPAMTPYSVLHKDLMQKTAHLTFAGMSSGILDKLKEATKNKRFIGAWAIAVGAATVGLAVGLATRSTSLKQQENK